MPRLPLNERPGDGAEAAHDGFVDTKRSLNLSVACVLVGDTAASWSSSFDLERSPS